MTSNLQELGLLVETVNRKLQNLDCMDPTHVLSHDIVEQDKAVRQIIVKTINGSSSHIQDRIESEYFGFGPIQSLIDQEPITEIIINGEHDIFYELGGRLAKHDDAFLSPLTFRNFMHRLGRLTETQISLDVPFVDGYFGDFRLHMAIPPATHEKVSISLRRHPKSPWNLDRLQEKNWARPQSIDLLRQMVLRRENFLVVGPTGSGKTSVLGACLLEIGPAERAVIIEDTSELRVPNAASTKLLTRFDPHKLLKDFHQGDLLKQSLRMRPDRIVMGEIRGGEAKDLLMAFATGHSGCMGTLHADSARQALLRLEMLIQLGASQWNIHAIRNLIHLSLSSIVVVQKRPDGSRGLEGIYKITSLEEVGFLLEKVC